VLVNGGTSPSRLSDGLGRRLPPGSSRLDWLVVAASTQDSLAALPDILERYPPGHVLWAGPTGGSRATRDLWANLAEADIPVSFMQTGQSLDLGEGARLQTLRVSQRGAVLLLVWDKFRLLLPSGLDFDLLEALEYGKAVGPVNALLLTDSGYAPLNPPEWIAALQPQLVLLSVRAGNAQGLPGQDTLTALQGYTLLRTDQNGWIKLVTDGEGIWVQVERCSCASAHLITTISCSAPNLHDKRSNPCQSQSNHLLDSNRFTQKDYCQDWYPNQDGAVNHTGLDGSQGMQGMIHPREGKSRVHDCQPGNHPPALKSIVGIPSRLNPLPCSTIEPAPMLTSVTTSG
jgi:hypothetical protein